MRKDADILEVNKITNNNLPSRGNDPTHPESIFYKSLLRATDEFEEPPVCLEVEQDDTKTTVFSLGNISTITGRAKSRKTYFISLIFALFLRVSKLKTAPQFVVSIPKNKRVGLYIDTEQGKFHAKKVLTRILRIAGLPGDEHPENIYYLSLRPYAPDERLKVIEHAISTIEGLGLVVIDGVRDVVFSINDDKEAIVTVTHLMRWSEEKNIHITGILHQNKNDSNVRGHLGTELVNKSESILTIEKDGDISIIKSNLRDRDFRDMAFGIDENDCPYILDEYQAKEKKTVYNDPSEQPDQFHINLLSLVFRNGQTYSFNEFFKAIKEHAANSDIKLGDHKAREWANYYLDNNFTENTGTNQRMIINHVKRTDST